MEIVHKSQTLETNNAKYEATGTELRGLFNANLQTMDALNVQSDDKA